MRFTKKVGGRILVKVERRFKKLDLPREGLVDNVPGI